jgi:carbamoyltransferase
MLVLGISCFFHDSAAAIISDKKIIAAAQEERFTRIKFDSSFPVNAIKYCLKEAGVSLKELDAIIFYDKPFTKFERIIETHLKNAPKGIRSFVSSMPIWISEKLIFRSSFHDNLQEVEEIKKSEYKLLFSNHHLSHAASAYFTSELQDSAVLVIDGVGEWATVSIYHGKGNELRLLKEMHYPDSVGLLYSSFTYFCGFKVNSGEYKLMGLAPYGNNSSQKFKEYKEKIKNQLLNLYSDGSIKLNQKYFAYNTKNRMIHEKKWEDLFNLKTRVSNEEVSQNYCDFALAAQEVLEEIVEKLAITAKELTNSKHLCLSGGVALNCVSNAKILRKKIFETISIHPASGDAGGALGSALAYLHLDKKHEARLPFKHSYLGPSFSQDEVENTLNKFKLSYEKVPGESLAASVANLIKEKNVVGWFQDRMEWGPRALGNRSILADPTDTQMQKKLNLKIKFREGFRPFAPIVCREDAGKYFDSNYDSDYMLFTANIRDNLKKPLPDNFNSMKVMDKLKTERSTLQAITHVDFSARLQTIGKEENPKIHGLLREFEKISGYPVLINTSFNVRGEPIVCNPTDAINCFLNTHMDVIVLDNFIVKKVNQSPEIQNLIGHMTFDMD